MIFHVIESELYEVLIHNQCITYSGWQLARPPPQFREAAEVPQAEQGSTAKKCPTSKEQNQTGKSTSIEVNIIFKHCYHFTLPNKQKKISC